jgi:hypothetical protein
MSMHKLTAGDGYTYLTRQVAAADATDKGHTSLGDYYTQKGESPGVWVGSGLSGLDGIDAAQHVSAEQMKALFGEGRHPNADKDRRRDRPLPVGRRARRLRVQGVLGQPGKKPHRFSFLVM